MLNQHFGSFILMIGLGPTGQTLTAHKVTAYPSDTPPFYKMGISIKKVILTSK